MDNQNNENVKSDKEPLSGECCGEPRGKEHERRAHRHDHREHGCCGRHHSGGGRFFFGFLLILVGGYYLAKNSGWLPYGFQIDFGKFWPILIIIAGLSLASGRSRLSFFLAFLFAVIIAALIAALVASGVFHPASLGFSGSIF